MDHYKNLEDVPDINSKEFEKFLEDNGFDKKLFNEDLSTYKLDDALHHSLNYNPEPNQPEKESIGKTLFKIVDNWCSKNSGPSMAIVLGGSVFICYKMIVGILSQAVFKGNLKTSRYFDKHAG